MFGVNRSFFKKFKFVVEIDGFAYFGFQKCSELEMEIAVIEQWEGGALTPNKSPGRLKFSNITLERGATKDLDMFTWAKQVADYVANVGLVDDEYKKNLDIVQQDRDGSELRRWNVTGTWPTKFTAGAWDNDADENVIEKMELVQDGFDTAA
jgi:phage tail-like protein